MTDLRGKMPFNINDQANLYGSKRKNLNADLHHNKNHNIFTDGYSTQEELVNFQNDIGRVNNRNSAMNNSFEAVADSVGNSLNRSPSLRKNKALG